MITKQVSTNKVARLARTYSSEVYLSLQNRASIYNSEEILLKSDLTYLVVHRGFVYKVVEGSSQTYGVRYLKGEYLQRNKFLGLKLESMFHRGGMSKDSDVKIQSKVTITKRRT